MAETADTAGNMYLVEAGTCTQSFNKGKFAAKVNDTGETMKQEWTLTYTSLQACAGDDTKKFTVTVEGVCTEEAGTGLTLVEEDVCSTKI